MRTKSTSILTALLLCAAAWVSADLAVWSAGPPTQPPDKAVAAFLDAIYDEIAAAHPTPEKLPGKGLYKPPPLANNDRTRREYHVASGLADILGYDFVKLAVIEEYRYRFRMFQLVAKLPEGSPSVAKARDIAEMLWLCNYPHKLSLDRREADLIRHTDAYLARVVSAQTPAAERGPAVLQAFVRACTFGFPSSELPAIRPPLGESELFARSVTFAKLTGLPFDQIGRVESIGGPLVLYGLARALPRNHPGRDEALALLRADKEWTYPPK